MRGKTFTRKLKIIKYLAANAADCADVCEKFKVKKSTFYEIIECLKLSGYEVRRNKDYYYVIILQQSNFTKIELIGFKKI